MAVVEGGIRPELRFSHNVIEHLGIKLYRNKAGNVLAELVANCWDADAKWVDIELDENAGDDGNGRIVIADNGVGMSFETIRDHYLQVGKPKRKSAKERSSGGRMPMGRKGLGKLAPFGIARTVDVATVHGGLLNLFTLDLDQILKVGATGAYPPKFHLQDVPATEVVALSDSYLTSRVNSFLDALKAGGAEATGTLICMSRIVANQMPTREFIAKELGSRFTVILLRPDFSVRIGSVQLTEEDALPKFEFRIPSDTDVLIEDVGGHQVKYWVGFVGAAEWPADEAGVGVFAHGKIAQTRPYFFNRKGKEVFQRYLYAVVEADWVDEEDEDLISTDRTAIDWSSPKMKELHDWGNKKVGAWITSYEAFRKEKQDRQVADQAVALRAEKKVNTYSRAENDQIVNLVSEATREIGKTKEAEATREELLIAVSKAWINQPTRIFLGELWKSLLSTNATPAQLADVVNKLSLYSVPEKMGLALTFSQRAFALSVLYELVHQRSETDLQRLVTEFPWILQPRGDLLTADKWLKTTIDAAADALGDESRYDPGVAIKGMDANQRADFVFLTSPDDKRIKVVEIKKPELPLGVEQERQLVSYLDFIKAQRSEAVVTGVLVGNRGSYVVNDRRIEPKTWSEIFTECRAVYVELLASMLEIADIEGGDSRLEVIKEIGGEKTWELLRRLAETDENLQILFRQFDAQLPPSLAR
ncbi:MAG TPA: ATP-binding protein [Devosia sp.]|nr:ATP-binding protein [Devosia sp.]